MEPPHSRSKQAKRVRQKQVFLMQPSSWHLAVASLLAVGQRTVRLLARVQVFNAGLGRIGPFALLTLLELLCTSGLFRTRHDTALTIALALAAFALRSASALLSDMLCPEVCICGDAGKQSSWKHVASWLGWHCDSGSGSGNSDFECMLISL
jgi:hypothetical protein